LRGVSSSPILSDPALFSLNQRVLSPTAQTTALPEPVIIDVPERRTGFGLVSFCWNAFRERYFSMKPF